MYDKEMENNIRMQEMVLGINPMTRRPFQTPRIPVRTNKAETKKEENTSPPPKPNPD